MKAIKCKAVSGNKEWVYGYPVVLCDSAGLIERVLIYREDGTSIEVLSETICYSIGECDMDGTPLFIGDIIDDFGGGVLTPNEDFDPNNLSDEDNPEWITIGETQRLGTIIFEDGTTRIETAELGYAYNISNGARLSETRYHSNQYDHLIQR